MSTLTENISKIESLIEEMESDSIELDSAIAHYKTLLTVSKDTLTQLQTYKKEIKVLTETGESLLNTDGH